MIQKIALCSRSIAAGIAAQRPIGGDDAMAGDEKRNGVGPIGPAYRARGRSYGAGDISIATGFAWGYGAKRRPDASLEIRAVGCEREIETHALAIEIFLQLIPRLAEQGGCFLIATAAPIKRDNGTTIFGDGDLTKGGMERELRHDA